jgi:hypothetical protein
MEVIGQFHALAALTVGKEPSGHIMMLSALQSRYGRFRLPMHFLPLPGIELAIFFGPACNRSDPTVGLPTLFWSPHIKGSCRMVLEGQWWVTYSFHFCPIFFLHFFHYRATSSVGLGTCNFLRNLALLCLVQTGET